MSNKRSIILSIILLVCSISVNAQSKAKTITTLQNQVDSLQAALEALSIEYDELYSAFYNESDEEIVEVSMGNEDFYYDANNIDSLLNVHSIHKAMLEDSFEYDNIETDNLTSNIPDSVYIKRLENIGSFIPLTYNSYVKNSIIRYTEKISSTSERILGLTKYYFPIIESILDEYDLPKELEAMAIIESALNPLAVSRAKARGMWQFMYNTAKLYGLKIDSFSDERYDPVLACRAAAQYLKDAYAIFGDWYLAIASYNCGSGNVNKAIRRSGGKTNFWEIYNYLPRETRGYIPQFIGATYLINYYKEHGLKPTPMNLPPEVDTIHVSKNLHFKQISENIGITLDELRAVNPQFIHDIVPGTETRTYVFNIPRQYTSAFIDKENEIYEYQKDSLMSQTVMTNIRDNGISDGSRIIHKVKSGETLGGIARRYGTTVANIKKWNNLKSNTIRIGQQLSIYGKTSTVTSSSSSATTAKTAPATEISTEGYLSYTVKSGDTLWSIANANGININDLYSINGLSKSSKIYPGMKIRIKKAE